MSANDSNIGKWRTKLDLSLMATALFVPLGFFVSAALLFGLAAPAAATGQTLPFAAGLQYTGMWLFQVVQRREWDDVVRWMSVVGIYNGFIARCHACLIVSGLLGSAAWVCMLPFAGQYRVRMRHVMGRGRLLVSKPYPAARAAAASLRRQSYIDPKLRRQNLYLSVAPGAVMGFDLEVKGFLVVGSPGGGKTVWFQYLMNQIMARSDHLLEMYKSVIAPKGQQPNRAKAKEDALDKLPLYPDKMWAVDVKGDVTSNFPRDDFMLLAPHDTGWREKPDGTKERIGYAWDVGKDVRGAPAAMDFAAALIPEGGNDPQWALGARVIFSGFIRGLQQRSAERAAECSRARNANQPMPWTEQETTWGWNDIAEVLNLAPKKQRELLEPVDPKAAEMYTFEQDSLSRTTASYLGIITGNVGPLIDQLASGWGDYPPEYRFSIREWLLEPVPKRRFVVMQMSGQVQATSEAWVRAMIGMLAAFTKSPELPNDDKRRVWLLADEAPQYFRKNDGFLKLIEVGRSKGFCAVVACQVGSQFETVWGLPELKTLEAMVGTKLIFKTGGGMVAKYLSEEVVQSSDWVKVNRSRNIGKERGGSVSREDVRELVVMPNWFESLRGIKGRGMEVAWLGPEYLCKLLVPFQKNWKPRKSPREGTVCADWVVSNERKPQKRDGSTGTGSGGGGGGDGGVMRIAGGDQPDNPGSGGNGGGLGGGSSHSSHKPPQPKSPPTGIIAKDNVAGIFSDLDMGNQL